MSLICVSAVSAEIANDVRRMPYKLTIAADNTTIDKMLDAIVGYNLLCGIFASILPSFSLKYVCQKYQYRILLPVLNSSAFVKNQWNWVPTYH